MVMVTTGRALDAHGQPIEGTGFSYDSEGPLAQLLAQRVSSVYSQPITGLPGWVVLGPSVDSFLDRTEVEPDATRSRPASVAEVHRTLRTRVSDDEWAESGFDGNLEKVWVLHGDASGDVVAAANLSLFDGSPADVGVLVARDARGRGHAAQVGATATFDAVQGDGIARWRSLRSNDASRRTAFRLGFQDDCVQLAIRPRVASTG